MNVPARGGVKRTRNEGPALIMGVTRLPCAPQSATPFVVALQFHTVPMHCGCFAQLVENSYFDPLPTLQNDRRSGLTHIFGNEPVLLLQLVSESCRDIVVRRALANEQPEFASAAVSGHRFALACHRDA